MKNKVFEKISVVIPIFNEAGSLPELLQRLKSCLSKTGIPFELIFVDDNSTDGTAQFFKDTLDTNVFFLNKEGKRGKAFSLSQGFEKATGDVICMIDADLQYPPEAIPEMIKKLEKSDIIVANRKNYKDSVVRKFLSSAFRNLVGRTLFGLSHDIQSGLKIFKREVINTIKFAPASQWTFDLEFLHRARRAGFTIQNFDITFSKRINGESKVRFAKTTLEIGVNALRLKARRIHPVHIPPIEQNSMLGAGIGHKKRKYITHTTIPHHTTALKTTTLSQKIIVLLLVLCVLLGLYINPLLTLQLLVGILSTIYFIDVLFNFYLITKSLGKSNEIFSSNSEIQNLKDEDLPTYTILCPLYREVQVVPQFLSAIANISWPKEKLNVILLLEEDDKETIEAASNMDLPSYVTTLVVPHSIPKTKPKACNYGLAYAKGEYVVIYDAEDIPDPMQLKKAYLGFKKAGIDVICLQAKLGYYNTHQNLLTRFFTAEYSLWFGLTLPGLVSMDTTLPLGGTSNHFKTKSLREIEGWDPFNVTEDADLGVRLFNKGFKTSMIDSETLEEANSRFGNWLRQRSRWIKGYMQTYLVHTRGSSQKSQGGRHSLIFHLVVGGKLAFVLINPFLWLATFSYFALYAHVGPAIEALYPTVIFYMAVFSLLFGNFLFLYYYMIAVAKKGQWNLIKFVLFVPLYWIMLSIGAFIALYQLILKPHYWEKTVHGFHLKKEDRKNIQLAPEPRQEEILRPRFAYAQTVAKSGAVAGGVLIGATVFSNFFNFLYNAYLGRRVSIEDFGLIALVGSFFYLSTIPVGAVSKTVTHRTAYLLGKFDTPIKEFWSHIRFRAIITGAVATAVWLALTPVLSIIFKSSSWEPFILFAPVWFIGIVAAVDSGFLSGNLKFRTLAILIIVDAFVKLASAFVFVESGHSEYVYASTPIGMAAAFLAGWIFVLRVKQSKKVISEEILNFPKKFLITSAFNRVSTIAFLSFDLILAKLFLPPQEAGLYALLSLIGKMVYFSGSLFSQFINPLISREEGANKNSSRTFYKLLFGSTLVSFSTYLAVGLFGTFTAPILLGAKVEPILYLLPIYGFAMFCFSISTSIVAYNQIRKRYLLSFINLFFAFSQILAFYFYHQSLEQIVIVMASIGIGSLVTTLFVHLVYEKFLVIGRNLGDLGAVLTTPAPKPAKSPAGLRILVFNWRDIRHTWAGGAESYVHELSKRWVKEGNSVTLFCGNDGKNPRNQKIDGVNIIRRGGFYMVYLWAIIYYLLKFRGKFDLIVDCENGIPFFTPFYTNTKKILLIHHVHQEVFRKSLIPPFSWLAVFLETKLMPFAYKNVEVVTVSPSSKDEIIKHRLTKKEPAVIYNGVNHTFYRTSKKSEFPLFSYVGRLKPYKNIDVAIEAFSEVVRSYPKARLMIVGEGESMEGLKKLTMNLGIEKKVIFTGFVSNIIKAKILSKSWVMLQPSMVEGWGITVIEANAAGTPVIASDVNGLKDSVIHAETGVLVRAGDVNGFLHAMVDFILDEEYRKNMSKNARSWSLNFSWNKSAKDFFGIITLEHEKEEVYKPSRFAYVISRLMSIF